MSDTIQQTIEQPVLDKMMAAIDIANLTDTSPEIRCLEPQEVEMAAKACFAVHEEYTKPLRDEIERLRGERAEDTKLITGLGLARADLRVECEALFLEVGRLKADNENLQKRIDARDRAISRLQSTTPPTS